MTNKELLNNWVQTEFENAIKIESNDCAYCTNTAKYVTTTNLGWNNPVCNFHLVLYGKKKKYGFN